MSAESADLSRYGPLRQPGVARVRIEAADAATAHRVADVIAARFPRTRPPGVHTMPDGLVEFDLYTDTFDIACFPVPGEAWHTRDE
jgi:hypothetical protein